MKAQKTRPFPMRSSRKDDSAGTDSSSMQRPSTSSNLDSGLVVKLMRLLRLDAESFQMRKARREYVSRISFSSHSQVSTVPLKVAAKMLNDSEEENIEGKTRSSTANACPRRSSQACSEGEIECTTDQPDRAFDMVETSIIRENLSCQEVTPHDQSNNITNSPEIMQKKVSRSNSAISFNSSVEVINIPRAKDYSRSTRHKLW